MSRFQAALRQLSPIQTLVLGFLFISLLGMFLLMLPVANSNGRWQSLLDALFMATSAVSTTGLGVVAAGSHYTLFGQIIILLLFQIGGLGYMTLLVFVMGLLGRKVSFSSGNVMDETLSLPSRSDILGFIQRVIVFTAVFAGAGTLALMLHWLPEYEWPQALYLGLFHSISAFCTAGFALFDNGFEAYQHNALFNIVINIISIGGAIGFYVLTDAHLYLNRWWKKQRPRRLTVHSKLALLVLAALSVMGTAVLLLAETDPAVSLAGRWWRASFQAFSAVSTTGFNTVPIGNLQTVSLLVLCVLMFIGAPAGGTGGGIKSTTFGVILLIGFRQSCYHFEYVYRSSGTTGICFFAAGTLRI